MSTTNNKLNTSNLSEAEQDVIIGTFVRKYENERLRERWINKLRTDYQVIRPTTKTPGTTVRKIILPIIALAACLLLFLVLPGMQKDAGDQLMASYLTEATIDNSRSEANSDLELARTRLIDNYAAGRFAAAVIAGEGLLLMPEATEEDRYHLGLAHLQCNNMEQAIARFTSLANQPTGYRTEARFYLGISLLSIGDTAAGLEALKEIKESDGRNFYAKAQTLLKAKWD
jgi:tetratricopeptide (TPR) repeat protein